MSRAFTLIELLVVISIIAILAGILLPVMGIVQEAARASTCAKNLSQVFMATMSYANDEEGRLPNNDNNPGEFLTWRTRIGSTLMPEVTDAQLQATFVARKSVLTCPAAAKIHPTPSIANGGWATYAQNYHVSGSGGASITMPTVASLGKTTTTMLYQEGAWVPASSYWQSSSVFSTGAGGSAAMFPEAPHRGSYVTVGFADGHMEKRPLSQIPPDITSPEGMLFWLGR